MALKIFVVIVISAVIATMVHTESASPTGEIREPTVQFSLIIGFHFSTQDLDRKDESGAVHEDAEPEPEVQEELQRF